MLMTLQRFIFLVLFLMTVAGASAQQSREELQKKEQELKKELSDLNRQLSETQKNKKLSLNELALIKRKVAKREELVRGINNQINELDNTIYLNELVIYRLRKVLVVIRRLVHSWFPLSQDQSTRTNKGNCLLDTEG